MLFHCEITAVWDCDLLVFHGHLLQETDGPVQHKLYYGSSKFSMTNFSQATSPCRKPSGKLCLVKSLGCERCQIHRSITLRRDLRSLTAGARGRLWVWNISLFLSDQAVPKPQRYRLHSTVIALSQKLKRWSAGIRDFFPMEERAGVAQYQLAATQKTSTNTLLRVTSCLDDGYPTTYVDPWVAECTWVQCLFAYWYLFSFSTIKC